MLRSNNSSRILPKWLRKPLAFETLEDRLTPATYAPTSLADLTFTSVNPATGVISGGTGNGLITLRSAVIASNANAGADIINLGAGLTYTLSLTGNDSASNTGDLDINDSLTINGNNAIVQGATAYNPGTGVYTNSIGDKIIGINQDGTFTGLTVAINSLTIRWGQNTIPSNDPSFAYTGAGVDVFMTGLTGNTISFSKVTITENTNVDSYGGGVNVDSGPSFVGADSVSNVFRGTVTFTDCTISNNKARSTGAGVNLFADKHDVTLANCKISGNVGLGTGGVGASGGGLNIRHTNGGAVNVKSSIISGNTGILNGGGVCISFNQTVTIQDSLISANTVLNNGTSSPRGGGLGYSGTGALTVRNSLVTGNVAQGGTGTPQGGGVYTGGSSMLLLNTTISGNSTTGDGGGFFSLAGTGAATLTNVTLTNNRAGSDGSGIGGGIQRVSGTVTLQNSIVDGNVRGGAATEDEIAGAVNADFSLIGNTAGATITGANNQLNVDAKLATLANNGGQAAGVTGATTVLQTHALPINSPALDAGSNALVPGGATTDPRGTGFARILDAADADTTDEVDLGAYESHPTIQDIADQVTDEDVAEAVLFNFGDADLSVNFTASSSNTALVPNGSLVFSGAGSTRTLTATPAANQSGSTTITVSINGGLMPSSSDTFVLTVNPLNDAPVLTPATPSLPAINTLNTTSPGALITTLVGARISDGDAGALQGVAIQSMTIGSGGNWQYALDGTTFVNFPAISSIAPLLLNADANSRVRFVPTVNGSGTPTITYRAWDRTAGGVEGAVSSVNPAGGGGTSAFSTAFESAGLAVTAIPNVTAITVNSSAAQRSRLTRIDMTFAAAVTATDFTGLGTIKLTRTAATGMGTVGTIVQTGASGANGLISVAQNGANGVTLTFSNANGAAVTAGVENGSLADGCWQLAMAINGYTSPLNDPTLRRRFGDGNNDGTVDATDMASFGAAFGSSTSGNPFDFDNNSTVNAVDLGEFGNRFGLTL